MSSALPWDEWRGVMASNENQTLQRPRAMISAQQTIEIPVLSFFLTPGIKLLIVKIGPRMEQLKDLGMLPLLRKDETSQHTCRSRLRSQCRIHILNVHIVCVREERPI
jgi:hypothetical protein